MSDVLAERDRAFEHDQLAWLEQQFAELTTRKVVLKPSEWSEQNRYLPPSVTPLPGRYSFEIAPYLREILDCIAPDSPVRELSWMKGAQICATTGLLENVIGYAIEHWRTAPVMLVTADAEMAKVRMESNITPMLEHSNLEHLIKSSDFRNNRKTGKTDRKIEWYGGGYLVPFGAKNENKLRSISIQILLRDEIDGWPLVVGRDGDPIKLSASRTNAYESTRKIVDVSTPGVKGLSKIEARFLRGDQRYYFVRCLKCDAPQTLRWRRTNNDTGEVTGIVWELNNGTLVPDSVRYLCKACGHPHTNDDKTRLLSPDNGAEWRPTAEPVDPHHRSYHLSALYSPVGMKTWAACVHDWLDAWDIERDRPKDMGALQVFYNNVLGETFMVYGDRVRFEQVSPHRRQYHYGTIPNKMAEAVAGGPILLLTCTVDVHKSNLAVAVFGWTRGRRAFLIDYQRFEGDTERLDNEDTWGRLRKLIEAEEPYVADDGRRYAIALTLIDSGYRADDVYQFASDYDYGVYPVKGRETPPKAVTLKEFSSFETPMGSTAFGIMVDRYKDRWSAALRRGWDGMSLQPEGHFNAPVNATDAQLKELTVEVRKAKRDKQTNVLIGYEWHRPSGAPNELWDVLIYANAALDMLAWDTCLDQLDIDPVNMTAFYDACEQDQLFFSEAA